MNTENVSAESIADNLEARVRRIGQIDANEIEFNRSVHLFEMGYLDSMGAVRLIEFIEGTYCLKLSEEQLNDSTFRSINGMARIVANILSQRNVA
ncbi:phosphopantetheine-binding protein [Nocardia arthritidis]|nr:phosphopantetheine-binding protein [Nocardia arthritidis]